MHKDRHAHSRRQRTDTQATKVDVKICDRGPTWGRQKAVKGAGSLQTLALAPALPRQVAKQSLMDLMACWPG